MTLVDSQGRLFGKISVLDVGAILVIMLVFAGIFLFPGTSGSSVIGSTSTKPVEVEALVRGLGARNPNSLLRAGDKTNLIIRNQPYGQIAIQSVQELPRLTLVPQPDGSVKALPDPRSGEQFSNDMLITLSGQAQQTDKGFVFGNSNIKVGSVIELDGPLYNFKASVIDVRIKS